MTKFIGRKNNQVSTNAQLGGMAFQDSSNAAVGNIDIESISGSPNIKGFDKNVYDTAVDIFVYDTSKDSDGGQWRKRTQHTSWYNETLNTATRGSRREFPAVAVIVAQHNGPITIYDGDDPDLPMWMVFNLLGAVGTNSNMLPRGGSGIESDITSIACLNGRLAVGLKDVDGSVGEGLVVIDFISELARIHRGTASGYTGAIYGVPISGRNSNNLYSGDYDSLAVVAETCNDVAMTVLPNAPIDDTTGLPVPTIAVGTDGGLSVIRDDGNVFDIVYTNNTKTVSVAFNSSGNLHFVQHDNDVQFVNVPIPTQDYANSTAGTLINQMGGSAYHTGNSVSGNTQSTILGDVVNDTLPNATSGSSGLTFISNETPTGYSQGAVAYATTSYNTGWMHGDIKGAFLSDTDTTNVTASTELVTNGTFDTDVSGWGSFNSTLAFSSNQLEITRTTMWGFATQEVTMEIGKKYVLTADARTNNSSYTASMGIKGSIGNVAFITDTAATSSTTMASISVFFTATQVTGYIHLSTGNSSGAVSYFDNVSLTEIKEEDRSVNNKGLQVFGTVTKSAVVTGAELVAYDDFGNSNYFEQPYNTELNFGTGDFSLMNWIYVTAGGDYQVVFDRWSPNGGNARFYWGLETSEKLYFHHREDSSSNSTDITGTTILLQNRWYHMAAVRRGTSVEVYLNGKLDNSTTSNIRNVTPGSTEPTLRIGTNNVSSPSDPMLSKLALLRISGDAPTPEQIKKIYEDEKVLFQENAACTLYGSSDAVTALTYDEKTNLLHVGTSSGRSDFQGLRRINNTTTAVTTTISAYDGLIAQQ